MTAKNDLPLPDGRPVIIPSVLSADFACLKTSLRGLERCAGWVQLDVMDGHFVPNLSFGPHIASCMESVTPLALDAHLMVRRPDIFIQPF